MWKSRVLRAHRVVARPRQALLRVRQAVAHLRVAALRVVALRVVAQAPAHRVARVAHLQVAHPRAQVLQVSLLLRAVLQAQVKAHLQVAQAQVVRALQVRVARQAQVRSRAAAQAAQVAVHRAQVVALKVYSKIRVGLYKTETHPGM